MGNIYIAGPMSGCKYFNFNNFDCIESELNTEGWDCFSPANNDRNLLGKDVSWMPTDSDHDGEWKKWTIPNAPGIRKMLGDDLAWIAKEADAIYMMRGWENSKGARAEHALAVALNLEIIYESI